MKKHKRTRVEIVIDVLENVASYGPIVPTRLATSANMPYDRLLPIVEDLVSKKILSVREEGRSRYLEMTPKGYKLLRELKKLRKLLRDFELDII